MKNITLTAAQIADITGGRVCGDANRTVTGVASVKEATAEQLSFVGNKRYLHGSKPTSAMVVLFGREVIQIECLPIQLTAHTTSLMILLGVPHHLLNTDSLVD